MNAELGFPDSRTSDNDTLLLALFIAVIIHVIIIVGVNFTAPRKEESHKTISITIANMPERKAPDKAKFLAQENQQAAGSKTVSSKTPAQSFSKPVPVPKKPVTKLQAAAKPQNKPSKPKTKARQKVITQQQAVNKINKAEQELTKKTPQPVKLTPELLARQVAQLGAEVRYKKPSSEQSRIKFINSVSTHKYLAAQYMEDWRRKVEKTGNMNYPEIARKKHFSGRLTMDVGIRFDGSIYSIRINKSSGYQLLDDAAKRIVRMSAPFAPLPAALRKELDVLVITRVWEFSDESGMMAH